jgi:23S rRNA (uracil1939-C5)-methyltransferase
MDGKQPNGYQQKKVIVKVIDKTINEFWDLMNIIPTDHIHCPHIKECSGCTLSEFVSQPPVYQEASLYFKEKGLELPLHKENAVGWRCRAKLAVRGTSENPHIGLFKEGTHEIVDIPFCKVHHPSINKAIEQVKVFIQEEGVVPYREESGKGDLRYIQAVVERKTGRIQLSLVINFADSHEAHQKEWFLNLKKLWQKDESFWHSIWLNYNTVKTNVIFGSKWELFRGEALLWETFGQTKVCFQPMSFAQANLEAFEKMLLDIEKIVPENATVVDYYSGVGVIGLTLVKKAQKISCCEINPQAEFCFEQAKKQLSGKEQQKITFHPGAAEKKIDLLEEADVIIVDPPRKGLGISFIEALSKLQKPQQLIYISCGWKSFQNDYEWLIKKNWNLKSAQAHLFFPGSNHIELLTVFTKEGNQHPFKNR